MEEDESIDFDEQIRLEEAEQARKKGIKTRTDEDGTVFEWDEEKKAWFPKLDDDFLARYQLNYGANELVVTPSGEDSATAALRLEREQLWRDYYKQNPEASPNGEQRDWTEYYNSQEYRDWYATYVAATTGATLAAADEPAEGKKEDPLAKKAAKKKQSEPTWYELTEGSNTHVYVQGLPQDITEPEFVEIMSKCGMIMNEPFSNKPRAKIYRDADGVAKGDGRCCYIKIESVDLALQIIDGMQLRNSTLEVQRAQFQLKGEFDPSKRRKLTKKEKKKLKEHQENLFRWAPEKDRFARQKREKAVILHNVFSVEEFTANALLLPEVKQKVEAECSKCGQVKRVIVHDSNHLGVVTVWFQTAEEADAAIVYLNNCIFYNRRIITAAVWDGKTKYDIEESPEDRQKRLDSWHTFLKSGNNTSDNTPTSLAGDANKAAIDTPTSLAGDANKPAIDTPTSLAGDANKTAIDTPTSLAGDANKDAIDTPTSLAGDANKAAIDTPTSLDKKGDDGGDSTDSDWLEGESDDEDV